MENLHDDIDSLFQLILFPLLCTCGPFFLPRSSMFPTSPCYELVINSAVPGVDLITSSVMAQTIWLNYFYSRTYTSFRHQADTHNRSHLLVPLPHTIPGALHLPTPTLSLHGTSLLIKTQSMIFLTPHDTSHTT